MDRPTLYDEDIVLWSERQAEALRGLKGRRDLPNELDLDNIIEEVESVGRSEVRAVDSHVRQFFMHLAKLSAEPDSLAGRLWRSEALNHRRRVQRLYLASMRQHLDVRLAWRDAVDAAREAAPDDKRWRYERLHDVDPPSLEELIDESLSFEALVEATGARAG
jgi:hypothetical protein